MNSLFDSLAANNYFPLVPWVIFFPAIGMLINIIFGGKLKGKLTGVIASLAVVASFVVAVLLAVTLRQQPGGTVVHFLDWITIGALQVEWAFRVDTLSVMMMLVVSGVGALIHIYAIQYEHEDVRLNGDIGRYRRFFVFFNLFIVMMMILVSGDSYLMLFVGWEGVGLCSYLLIGFWFEKGENNIGNAIAAKKAMVLNRIGDFGFLIAAFLIFNNFGSLQFETVFAKAPGASQGTILAITLFLLLGVTGKSAQLPLYVWLPDAMAGPTPVSALIHAATMVTAGVYLIARSHALYALSSTAQLIVALVGGLTALFAATIAVGQFDIKKVLAYSTISQLGYMVAAVGMGAFTAGLFHLVTHAFFKALLFLSAGSVIQGIEAGENEGEHGKERKEKGEPHAPPGKSGAHAFDPQDMRNMGGLYQRMPVTFIVYVIGALALSGIPPLAGFWSKDSILAEARHTYPGIYWLLTIAAFLTAFYMGRQIWMVFFGEARSRPVARARENPPLLVIPLVLLAVLSLLGGALNLPGPQTLSTWLNHTLGGTAAEKSLNLVVAGISTALALVAIALAYYLYGVKYQEQQKMLAARRPLDPLKPYIGPVFTGMQRKWWVDEAYEFLIVQRYKDLAHFLAQTLDERFWHDWFHETVIYKGYLWLAGFLAQPVDLGIIDRVGDGLADLSQGAARVVRRIQSGFVRSYAMWVFTGLVFILAYLIFR